MAGSCENTCGYMGKVAVIIMAVAGIILSIMGSSNCQFLTVSTAADTAAEGLEAPFEDALEAHVGVFSYEIVRSSAVGGRTGECVKYDGKYSDADLEVLVAAQFCALFGPIVAGLALFVTLLETCFCDFSCSFLIASILYLGAAGIQAGTFSVFAEPTFCIDGDYKCDVGVAVYFNGAAVGLYWFCCLLVCCIPRPDPLFKRSKSPTRRNSKPAHTNPTVSVQQNNGFEDEGSAATSKKTSNKKNDDGRITDDDFDTHTEVAEGTRVEYKEKTFPDGTRQVDEITHYADGSRSVKTQNFGPDDD